MRCNYERCSVVRQIYQRLTLFLDQIAPGLSLVFTREGDELFMQPTGQSKTEIFPESETEFFLAVADVQVTFVKDDKGQVHQAILNQTGRKLTAKRIK